MFQKVHRDKSKLPKEVVKDGAKWLFVPTKVILDTLCVWPESQNNFTFILHVFTFMSYSIFMYGSIRYMTGKDVSLGDIALTITVQTVMVETTVRRLLSYFYRKPLENILQQIYFDFWPSDAVGKELHKEILKGSWNLMIFWSVYTFSAFMWGMQYMLVPYLKHILPYFTTFPFDWKKSPVFELLYVWQAFFGLEIPFNICALDMFFATCVFNCVAQFKLLRFHITEDFEKAVKDPQSAAYDSIEARAFILNCVRHHYKLIKVCEEIDKVFTYFILTQYLTSMGSVCLSSFVATVIPEQIGVASSYFLGHICELLIYCYMGNDLIIESTELAKSIYRCGWHLIGYDKDLRNSLMMMMIRSQKPIKISAGGFGYLSLASFMKLVQFSFSVFTLLNSIMKKQKIGQ